MVVEVTRLLCNGGKAVAMTCADGCGFAGHTAVAGVEGLFCSICATKKAEAAQVASVRHSAANTRMNEGETFTLEVTENGPLRLLIT